MTAEAFNLAFHPRRFGRAVESYEASASVQGRMANVLLELFGEEPHPSHILEFGCGTGLLTRKLWMRFPSAIIHATDASPRMLEKAAGFFPAKDARLRFALLDAENRKSDSPSFSTSPFDLIGSNALTQWFPDLQGHLNFASTLAKPGAVYLISGFSRTNFPELNTLLSEPPFSYRNFPGHEPDKLLEALKGSGWALVKIRSWEEKETLPTAREVLRRIQKLGSSRDPREGGKMNRKNLEGLLKAYEERFAVTEGVQLTWRPWAAMLQRNISPPP